MTDEVSGPDGRRLAKGVLVAGILLYLFVATFPGEIGPLRPGLDPSWAYAINRLPHTTFRFGADVVFTYGPLGYLITPLNLGGNLTAAAALWAVSQVLLVGAVIHHYRERRSLVAVSAFMASFLLAVSFGLLYEYRLLILLGLLLSVPREPRWLWRGAVVVGALLASLLLFTKVSTGIAAASMIGAAAIVWRVRATATLAETALVIGVYSVATVTLGVVLLGGLGNLFDWLGVTAELSSGYVGAMSVQGPTILMVAGLAAVGLYALFVVATWRWNRVALPLALVFGAGVFFAYRHAFVRHQGRFVYGFLLAIYGVFMLTARGKRALALGAVAAVLVIPSAAVAASEPFCSCPWFPRTLAPAGGLDRLVAVADLADTRRRLDQESTAALAPARLPEAWVEEIGSESVDVLPFELSIIPANGLQWVPNPVLQSYHAFTSGLDGWVAEHFAGAGAPTYLLLQFGDIDGRNHLMAEPALWRAVARGYQPRFDETAPAPSGEVALLHQRPTPLPAETQSLGSMEGRVGEWLEIPASIGLVLASVELRTDLDGRLAQLFWRIAPVYLDLRYADGSVRMVRILPSTAAQGMLVNRPPFTLRAFLRLLDGRWPPAAVSMRVHGPGTGSFDEEFRVTWRELSWDSSDAPAS
jgi:hypothetical protein